MSYTRQVPDLRQVLCQYSSYFHSTSPVQQGNHRIAPDSVNWRYHSSPQSCRHAIGAAKRQA